ncbi:MAG: hypothetical protein KIS78_19000 [Labilithrix sp.]|nr:hypothetical protein [Labilithrix sp.]
MIMNRTVACLLLAASVLVACDEKKDEKKEESASASAAPAATPPPPEPSAAPAPPETAPAPSASSDSSMITGDAKDVVLTVKDPKKKGEKTIQAAPGGSVTVFLPDYPGTVWSIESNDKALGKAKEEVIPGFAPGTNGHQFKWTTAGPSFKAGQKHKVHFVNKKAGDKAAKPTESFTLTIEIA